MKILVGTSNIANNVFMLRDGFRQMGLKADAALITHQNPFYTSDAEYIIKDLYDQAYACQTIDQIKMVLCSPEWKNLLDYDVYVFVCSSSLLPGNEDFEVLKSRNKMIICYNTGSDFRYGPIAKPFYLEYGVKHPLRLSEYITDQTDSRVDIGRQSLYTDSLSRKLHNVRMAEYYADALFTLPCVSNLNVKPYMSLTVLGDPKYCEPLFPDREVPLILHCPSNPLFKHSVSIINTVLALWKEGLSFEFKMIQNVRNNHVIRSLKNADILLDQISVCCPALLALEGMASGCATLTCNEKDVTVTPTCDIPAINITHLNLKERLKEIILDHKSRYQIARDARDYILQGYHTPIVVAQNILEGLCKSLEGDFDCYPTTFFDYSHFIKSNRIYDYSINMTHELIQKYGIANVGYLDKSPLTKDLDPTTIKTWDTDSLTKNKWGYRSKTVTYP